MQNFIDIYGDIMQQKHRNCQNCCVLIQVGDVSQCGLILTCSDRFGYVLTTESSMLHNAKEFVITFGDEIERNFNASNVVVHTGNKLSILFLHDGIGAVQSKQSVQFSIQDNKEAVVYTLSYIPKAFYKAQNRQILCAPATSWFRGGNLGIVDRKGDDIFYHNCCAGTDITNGSAVLNGSCELIGMNMEHSAGWTMALCLSTIKNEIAEIFPDTQYKTFADIQEYLKAKGEVEANKTNI